MILLLYIVGAVLIPVLAYYEFRSGIPNYKLTLCTLAYFLLALLVLYVRSLYLGSALLFLEIAAFYYSARTISLANSLREGISKTFYDFYTAPYFVAISVGDTEIFGYPRPIKGYRILILKGVKGIPTKRPIVKCIKGQKKEKYDFNGVTLNIYNGCAKYYSAHDKKWLKICGEIGILDFP